MCCKWSNVGFTGICGYVERGALIVRVLARAHPLAFSQRKSSGAKPKANSKELTRPCQRPPSLPIPKPLTNVHPQHFLPITCFFLIILPLLHLIEHVQIPLKTSVHSHYIHYKKCSALSLACMHHLAYLEQRCLSLRSMSHYPSLLLLVSSGQRLLSCLHSSLSPLRQLYLGP